MPRVSDEHRAARREQILLAAMTCVAREGFHKTTMAHVIAESELSAGAVYGYFKGKPDLIRSLAGRVVGGIAEMLEGLLEQEGPLSPQAAMAQVVEGAQRITTDSGGNLPLVALHAWSEAARDAEVREIVRENLDAMKNAWVKILARSEQDGTLAPGGDHVAMARVLVGVMPGYVIQGALLGDIDGAGYLTGFTDLLSHAR